jgi:hypothetical protein
MAISLLPPLPTSKMGGGLSNIYRLVDILVVKYIATLQQIKSKPKDSIVVCE